MNTYLLLSTLNLALGGLVFLLGIVILRENPGHRVNRAVALMLFFGGLRANLPRAAFLPPRPGAAGGGAAPLLADKRPHLLVIFCSTLFHPALPVPPHA